jgi:hypothetical protein
VIQAQGALDHPAAGQDLEGVQGIGPFDDLDGQVQPGGRPREQLPGVAAVGPGPADAAAGAREVEQQRPGGVAVLDRCGRDQDFQQQAGGVDGDVAFAAVDLLGVVPAPGRFGHGRRGAHRLGVDHRGGRLSIPAGRHARLSA